MKRAMSVAVADIAPAGAGVHDLGRHGGLRVVGVAVGEAGVELVGQRLRERRRGHADPVEDLPLQQLVEGHAADPLGDVNGQVAP